MPACPLGTGQVGPHCALAYLACVQGVEGKAVDGRRRCGLCFTVRPSVAGAGPLDQHQARFLEGLSSISGLMPPFPSHEQGNPKLRQQTSSSGLCTTVFMKADQAGTLFDPGSPSSAATARKQLRSMSSFLSISCLTADMRRREERVLAGSTETPSFRHHMPSASPVAPGSTRPPVPFHKSG